MENVKICESFLQNVARRVAVMRGFTLFKHCRGVGFKMPKNTFYTIQG